jgi:DNA-directed RNA polymerase subunit H (RpoH/RPB5)
MLSHIVRSFITLKEMMKDRNVDISNLDSISHTELETMYKINPVFSISVNKNLSVIYHMSQKFTINSIKKILIPECKTIFIFKEKINTLNIKNLKELTGEQGMEIFTLKELLINISKHKLVPKHEILSENEVKDLLDKYQLKQKTMLPIIQKTDPMARYLDVKAGEIVKVTRPSQSAGDAIVYRYCV